MTMGLANAKGDSGVGLLEDRGIAGSKEEVSFSKLIM